MRERWNRASFVHEFTHFRQWRKTGRRTGRKSDEPAVANSAYYNQPHEIEAFTTEAMALLAHDAREQARWPEGAAEWIALDDAAWFALVRRRMLDDDFYAGLTSANKAKVRRLFLKFIKSRVLPILQSQRIA